MSFIVLNKVLNNAGDSVQVELHRDNVKCIEPIMIRVGGIEVSDRRRVGAQSRVHTGLPGCAYFDVLESSQTIRQLLRPIGDMIGGEQRTFPALDIDMVSTEGMALVDTNVKTLR